MVKPVGIPFASTPGYEVGPASASDSFTPAMELENAFAVDLRSSPAAASIAARSSGVTSCALVSAAADWLALAEGEGVAVVALLFRYNQPVLPHACDIHQLFVLLQKGSIVIV